MPKETRKKRRPFGIRKSRDRVRAKTNAKMVTVHGRKKLCRVTDCILYGKPLYPLDLALHVVQEHNMNMATHDLLEECSLSNFKQHKADMKYRKAGYCKHPYCQNGGKIIGRLDKHLKRMHSLTVSQYNILMEMYNKQRLYIRINPKDKSTKLEDFCPTMNEKLEVKGTCTDELHVPRDYLGYKPYPKRRMRTIQIKTESIRLFNMGTEIKVDSATESEMVMTFNVRKVVLSDEHEELFIKSILWPVEGKVLIRLRKVKCQPWSKIANQSVRTILHSYLTKCIRDCIDLPIEYQCFICTKWHNFELSQTPRYTPADLNLFNDDSSIPKVEIYHGSE